MPAGELRLRSLISSDSARIQTSVERSQRRSTSLTESLLNKGLGTSVSSISSACPARISTHEGTGRGIIDALDVDGNGWSVLAIQPYLYLITSTDLLDASQVVPFLPTPHGG